ncbi:MAG TPA: glutamine--fructose-6-phosphate transaminase (isomerizing) [Pseudobdellovibrionaceae bacterium]|nr:glutamine--fructose-6-phosphate transaminase (isomerizing) [Pseudobdellovibrionaceae bacterium]
MCGIVGYWGSKDPKQVIVDGLKRLEYRGYDSAGIAVLDQVQGQPKFRVVRAQGKLMELSRKLEQEKFSGQIGIGHTRWATHGVPSERNAHPHSIGGVTLVHNGIIENYQEIRQELAAQGSQFLSDTDSELVAHLLSHEVKQTGDLHAAVLKVWPRLIGAYAIVAVWEQQPDVMVAFKNGPPLVLGVGDGEIVVASDVQAIISTTKRVVYLNDNEVVKVKGANYEITDHQGRKLKKDIVTIDWSADLVEKAGFNHFMLKEIHEQPRAVANAMAPHVDLENQSVRLTGLGFSAQSFDEISKLDSKVDQALSFEKLKNIDRIFIIACGTSHYAGLAGKYLIEQIARIPVEVDIASEFRYREPFIPPRSLVLVISQSGETADTLAALRLAKQAGALTLSICNVRASSIDREAHGHLYMNSGPEIGVASTKAFVSTLAVLNLFALQLGKLRSQLDRDRERRFLDALLGTPAQMEAVLAYDSFFAEAAATLKAYRGILFMGRGINYPIALEGALKLKELAYMHAEGYAAGEMKHGPLALIDERMLIVMVCPSDKNYEKTLSNLEEAKARGGKIISIGTGDNSQLKNVSDHYLSLPKAEWTVNPILEAIPVQLLAYHVANALGHDVDQPRNLAKSVTVE